MASAPASAGLPDRWQHRDFDALITRRRWGFASRGLLRHRQSAAAAAGLASGWARLDGSTKNRPGSPAAKTLWFSPLTNPWCRRPGGGVWPRQRLLAAGRAPGGGATTASMLQAAVVGSGSRAVVEAAGAGQEQR